MHPLDAASLQISFAVSAFLRVFYVPTENWHKEDNEAKHYGQLQDNKQIILSHNNGMVPGGHKVTCGTFSLFFLKVVILNTYQCVLHLKISKTEEKKGEKTPRVSSGLNHKGEKL